MSPLHLAQHVLKSLKRPPKTQKWGITTSKWPTIFYRSLQCKPLSNLTSTYIDLQKLQCAECSYILNEIIAAKLFCEIHPKCENCKKRKKKENIWWSPCCGKTYCFMCMSEFLFQKCFCNAGLSQEIQGYLGEFRKGMDKYLGLFEVVISKI